MELDNDTLKHCIFSLLTGLEIQNIDLFMERLSPVNCIKLGRAHAQAVRGKIVGRETRKITERQWEDLSNILVVATREFNEKEHWRRYTPSGWRRMSDEVLMTILDRIGAEKQTTLDDAPIGLKIDKEQLINDIKDDGV